MTMNQGNMTNVYNPSDPNPYRKAFNRSLAPEHQDFFNNKDRFIISNAGLVPGKGNKVYRRIEFIPQKCKKISVFYYDGAESMDDYSRSCIHAYALMGLYAQDWQDQHNPDYADMLGSIITILSSYTYYNHLKESGLETILKQCNIEVELTRWQSLDEVNRMTREAREAMAIIIGLDKFDVSPQSFTIIALSTLILIGKNVTEVNRDGWFRNRWRGLANVATVQIDADRLVPPILKNCQALYSVCAANQPIRSCLFKTLRSLASIPTNETHVIFDRIVRLLQWAEMSHIWMIMEYLYGQHPDVLNFPELRGPEISNMTIAISFLKRFPPEDRAFLKLIHDHNDLIPLHSGNFIYFTAAAHAIAALTKTSMININARFSETVKDFQERVKGYISNKTKIGPLAAAVSYTTTMPEQVKTVLIKSIEGAMTQAEAPDFEDRHPEARE